jgi:hypothetical protein
MISDLNHVPLGVSGREDASHLIASASKHIVRARVCLESAADSVPVDQTVLLLKVASRFTPLADAMKQLAAAFAQRSI